MTNGKDYYDYYRNKKETILTFCNQLFFSILDIKRIRADDYKYVINFMVIRDGVPLEKLVICGQEINCTGADVEKCKMEVLGWVIVNIYALKMDGVIKRNSLHNIKKNWYKYGPDS